MPAPSISSKSPSPPRIRTDIGKLTLANGHRLGTAKGKDSMSSLSDPHSGAAARRSFLKLLVATPLFATIATRSVAKSVATATGMGNPYEKLGIRPLINARGTYTYVGGSLELPGVRRAVEAASHQFVDMFELQHAAGKRLA